MVITETKQSKTNKNNRTEREDELNINKQNKTEIKEIKENRNKNMNMITVCAWTAGIFSGTKCNHFPIFFPVFYYFFFFSVYFLWTSFLAPFFSNYRSASRPSFYHSASAGFMTSVILNREYLAKVVLWKKLELKARHNRKRNLLHTYSLYKFCQRYMLKKEQWKPNTERNAMQTAGAVKFFPASESNLSIAVPQAASKIQQLCDEEHAKQS